ncbi:lipoprotein [Streptococcus sp. CM6]|uniref:Bacterial lipoprotein n=2 Tax=Streptococcus TaxID=1301 RepID=F9Q3I8_STROR|nr:MULTISPECIES: SP_0198 family lipoprotein [Streptococcus]EGV01451.1 bacterial lipoprotein [Streptococcus oralis SK313]EUC82003.1 lipoprotein [Streptococcus sp. CM6]MBS3688574.1 lipocalin/fatty acid-binding family protein [Streptococcus oralis]MBZ2082526.1 lipocalin/fatty acid-binding family protein [Streptococcus oralis]MCY7101328.1 SP_0198 family lipoprotein [Streptococcus oralis]
MKTKTFTLSIASLAILSLLVACGPKEQASTQPSAQQSSTQQESSSSAATSASQPQASSSQDTTAAAQPTNIDGTYTGKDENDQITLVVTGKTGTWTEVEADGDKEIKQVTFEPENQRVIIGDDVKIYAVNGNQMIIDDMDREAADRVVLTKQ